MKMGKRKLFSGESGRLFLLLGIFYTIVAPICSEPYGSSGRKFFGKKIEYAVGSGSEETEEHCERLPPKYSNASGSLEFARFDLLSLLKHGTDLIDETKYVDKATLILGNTGSGKTTVSQILSGKLDSLHAVLTQSDRLVIIDDQFKISGPSTTSKTLIPELVIRQDDESLNEVDTNVTDDNGPTIYYDCPGFDDTRGPDQDLAANFFMNHIVRRKVNQVKMLFLVIHSSVKMGNDRLDFDLLTSHAVKFVKNLEKYEDSIGLVVTKVNSYNARGRYIPDKTILKEIVEFLQAYHEAMNQKLTSISMTPEEKHFVENKIKFVEIFLQRNKNGDYPRITFSRNPEKCGPLSQSPAVLQNRQRILTLSEKQLEYRSADSSDFGYTLKDSTALSIRRVSQNINQEMASGIQSVITHFENWVEKVKFGGNDNLTEVLTFAENTHEELSKLVDDLTSHSNTSSHTLTATAPVNVIEIARIFKRALRKIGYHISSKFEDFMERQQAYIEFFEADDSSKILETWIESSVKLRDVYVDVQTWCKFCLDVEQKVSTYSFHVKKNDMTDSTQYSNATGWLRFLEIEARFPVPLPVKEFARKMDENENRKYFGAQLNKLMRFSLEPVTVKCSSSSVHVTSNFVKLSEFTEALNDNSICPDGLTKKVEIYASHTCFIDNDIIAPGRELNIVIIAPQWRVIGKRQFNLEGSNALPVTLTKAQSGRDGFGENGTNGDPGKPGGAGGSLFGVTEQVSRDNEGASLLINCNGGNGSRGQDGGDGGRGLDGRPTAHGSDVVQITDVNLFIYTKDRQIYRGYDGTNGGHAGVGGYGGDGGRAGKFSLNILGKKSTQTASNIIQVSQSEGKLGRPGEPGKGGQGGKPGDSMNCYKHKLFFVIKWDKCETGIVRGSKGMDGYSPERTYNVLGQQYANSPEYTIVKWKSLLDFKQNFYDFKTHQYNKATDSLLQLVYKNTNIMHVESQLQFFQGEFQFLEQLSTSPVDVSYLIPLYSDFIEKIEIFSGNTRIYMDSAEKRNSNLLLATAYSKLVNLNQCNSGLGYNLDLQLYISRVKQQLESYSTSNLTATLEELQRKYEMALQSKAGNVLNFMENVVMTSILKAATDQNLRQTVLERRFTQLVDNSAEVSWENIKWQLQRGMDIQETLEMKQILEVVPLTMDVISFMADEDLVDFLTSSQINNATWATMKAPDFLEHISNLTQQLSEAASSTVNETMRDKAETYLGQLIASGLYDKFSNNSDKMARLEELLEHVEILLTDVHENRIIVQQSFAPLFKSLTTYFNNLRRGRGSENVWHIAKQAQVKENLQTVKRNLATLVDGVDNRMYLNVFDGIQDTLTMIINLYENIEQYSNIRKLTNYMISYQSPTSGRNSGNRENSHPFLRILEQNLLEREYQRALLNVRQWAFPFAKMYRENTAPYYFSNFSQAQNFYIKQVENLEEERSRALAMMNSSNGVFHREDFYNEPFFVWENSKWNGEIRDLLAGKKVNLKADIKHAPGPVKHAVKFHLVELNFKVKDRNGGGGGEDEISNELDNFRVVMTHSGVSYYKFKRHYYVMTGMKQTIRYTFERVEQEGGNLEESNNLEMNDQAYGKFKRGEFHMSPYTMWTVQLERVENGENGTVTDSFKELQKWAKRVDVELVGTGIWLEAEGPDDLEVEKYYERDESLEEDDFGFSSGLAAEVETGAQAVNNGTRAEGENEISEEENYDDENFREGAPTQS